MPQKEKSTADRAQLICARQVTAAGRRLLLMLDKAIVSLREPAPVLDSEAIARCADVSGQFSYIIEAAFFDAPFAQRCSSELRCLRSGFSRCARELSVNDLKRARAALQDCRDNVNALVWAAERVLRDAEKDAQRAIVDEEHDSRPASESPESDMPVLGDHQEEFQREMSAFDSLLPDLLRSHPGVFVAVFEGQVIDKDEDEFVLAERVERTHRDRFVLIRRVSQEMTQDFLESPEVDMR